MPIYTYRCENCGIQFEQQQRFSDPPLIRCPECKKNALRKVYTPVGIVFKGSGFYATDHRSPSGAGKSTHTTEKNGEKDVQKTEPAKAEASTPNLSKGESK